RLQGPPAMLTVENYGGGDRKISSRRADCPVPPPAGRKDHGARARPRRILPAPWHLSSRAAKRYRSPKPLLRDWNFHLSGGNGKDLAFHLAAISRQHSAFSPRRISGSRNGVSMISRRLPCVSGPTSIP